MSKFRVTKPNGEQSIVESDLSYSAFCATYSPSTDILPLPSEEPESVVEEAPKPKRKKVAEVNE